MVYFLNAAIAITKEFLMATGDNMVEFWKATLAVNLLLYSLQRLTEIYSYCYNQLLENLYDGTSGSKPSKLILIELVTAGGFQKN